MLEAAVVAGLASAGADAVRVGVLPTPAVAFLVADLGADLGVMISASHNPMPDNGIKLFAAGGHKLPDAVESAVEDGLGAAAPGRPARRSAACVTSPTPVDRYLDHLLAGHPGAARRAAGGGRLRARRRVHGRPGGLPPGGRRGRRAARRAGRAQHQRRCRLHPPRPAARRPSARTAPTSASPTTATPTAASPSTPRAPTSTATRSWPCSPSRMREAGELAADTLVATVMSNLGLHLAMQEARHHGAHHRRSATATCSRSCAQGGFSLGGEQSGHVVLPRHATTGDGLLTALRLMARMAATGTSPRRPRRDRHAAAAGAGERARRRQGRGRRRPPRCARPSRRRRPSSGDTGRVLLRPSGTEQLVRVMVEAPTAEQAKATAVRLAEVVAAAR